MGIATSGSVIGTLIGMVFLALFTPVLGDLALKFGAYEFFWLALFGVVIAGTLTGDDPLKGWLAGLVGIFCATVGQEAIYAYDRFAFGSRDLAGGFNLVPALVGAFGMAELLVAAREQPVPVMINPFDSVIPKLVDVTKYWRTILRSGVIGTFIGILPGVGEDVAAWSSYAAAKRASKEKELYGKGSIEGLMAAETGDNACVPGAIIPVLTLGDPRLGARGRADGRDDHPRRAPGPDDHDRGADLRVRRRRDDAVRDDRHPDLRAHAHAPPDPRADRCRRASSSRSSSCCASSARTRSARGCSTCG